MRIAIYLLLLAVPIYALSWSLGYILFVGWHFQYFTHYLYLDLGDVTDRHIGARA
jgi:hypothetical protein